MACVVRVLAVFVGVLAVFVGKIHKSFGLNIITEVISQNVESRGMVGNEFKRKEPIYDHPDEN